MAEKNESWTITMENFTGFCPVWFENSYPWYGNKNQAADMQNIDIIDPNVLTQGPGLSVLTNGNKDGAVTTLITDVLNTVVSSNVGFALGGAKLYKFSLTVVQNDAAFPHTITGSGVVTGSDLVHYKGKVIYSYNDSTLDTGSPGGNLGAYDVTGATFDDDYWTTALSGTILQNAPHYMMIGGDDILYITNGQYIASLDGTTDTEQGIDFWQDSQTVSLAWYQNRVVVAVNRPNVSGSNFNESGIYRWDGVSPSWEGDPIEVSGAIGALYVKNGVLFVWWQDSAGTGAYQFGYVDGLQLMPLRRFDGSLPNHNQVGEYQGFLAWVSGDEIYLWGSRDADVPTRLFQYMSGRYAAIGTFGTPFGVMMVSSNATTVSYDFSKESGYSITSNFKTIAMRMTMPGYKAQINLIQVQTEQLSSGAKCDFTLYYDQAKSNIALDQIAYSTSNITIHKILTNSVQVEDFMLKADFANGSISYPVKIRSILINGVWIKNK